MDNTNNIIERIKAVAKQQGVTQTFLCKRIGKRATYLNEVKLGKDRIHDNEVEVIASILNTTPAYLRGDTDDPAPVRSEAIKISTSPTKKELIDAINAMSDEQAELFLKLIKQVKNI